MSWPALALAGMLGLILAGIHLLERRIEQEGGRSKRPEGARWASKRDLRSLEVEGPQPGRLVLGRHGRRLIAAEDRSSVVVVGPSTVSLKTTGFAIPALLEWDGPAITTSVKSDLLLSTIAARRKKGKAMVFDPTNATPIAPVKATPLSACGEWRGAMRVAHWLAGSARAAGSSGLEDAEFWYTAAEKLLAPLLYAAAPSGGQMADVIRWLNKEADAEEEVTQRLVRARSEDALGAATTFTRMRL